MSEIQKDRETRKWMALPIILNPLTKSTTTSSYVQISINIFVSPSQILARISEANSAHVPHIVNHVIDSHVLPNEGNGFIVLCFGKRNDNGRKESMKKTSDFQSLYSNDYWISPCNVISQNRTLEEAESQMLALRIFLALCTVWNLNRDGGLQKHVSKIYTWN